MYTVYDRLAWIQDQVVRDQVSQRTAMAYMKGIRIMHSDEVPKWDLIRIEALVEGYYWN